MTENSSQSSIIYEQTPIEIPPSKYDLTELISTLYAEPSNKYDVLINILREYAKENSAKIELSKEVENIIPVIYEEVNFPLKASEYNLDSVMLSLSETKNLPLAIIELKMYAEDDREINAEDEEIDNEQESPKQLFMRM